MPSPKPALRLTARRHAHAARRTVAPTFRGEPLRHSAAVESRYVAALTGLAAVMSAQVRREVLALFASPAARVYFASFAHNTGTDAAPGPNANMGAQARMLVNDISKRFEALFGRKAPGLAGRMVDDAAGASKTALHASLRKLTGGMSLKTSVMTPQLNATYSAAVAQNVGLIKTIAGEYLDNVRGSVMRSITSGRGLQDLIPDLEKYDGYSQRKAKNVALDQTRKTYNAINRGRMTAIGLREFEWLHSGGGAEPRPDHEAMDGQVYSFDNPPVIDQKTGERGIPGQAINCKCTMRPVFNFRNTDDE